MDPAMKMLLDQIISNLESNTESTQLIQGKVSEIEKKLAVMGERNETHVNHCPINERRVKKLIGEVIQSKDYDNLTSRPKKSREVIMWAVVIILSVSQIYNIFF